MKHIFLVFICFISTICFSQNENILAKQGTITSDSNQKINFNNLRMRNDSFIYLDLESSTEKSILMDSVKYIEDLQKSRVFSNKAVIDKTRVSDSILLANENKLILEKNTKLYEESRRISKVDEIKSLQLYPDGIYKTKEDFINKKPSSTEAITPKGLFGFEKPTLDYIVDNCFFYYTFSDEKIKNVFALSYKGHLYFQIYSILENRNKTDRAQSNDQPNSFVRVLFGGENYYYTEANLVNQWAKGLAYSGGAVGGAIASSLTNAKGVVWDVKNKEFNIFKNCKDFNDFIQYIYPKGVQECKNQQANINLIRKSILEIK